MDPQGNATTASGLNKRRDNRSIIEVLFGKATWKEAIKPTEIRYLKILPSSPAMLSAEVELMSAESAEMLLKQKIQEIRNEFDFIFLDCPPSMGYLTLSSLIAADSVIIPLQSEYFALEGLSDLLSMIKKVQKRYNPDLDIEGVLITMHDERTVLSRQVETEARRFFPGKVFKTIIPRNVRLSEAPSYGKPIILYDIRSKGARAYINLAKELLGE